MKIYTKSGDGGDTGLYGGGRVSKTDPRIVAIGDVDELNATVGLARLHASGEFESHFQRVQNWLFDFGAELATPPESRFDTATIGPGQIQWLEESIDQMTEGLEPLCTFILPGGSPLGAALHHARTVCRRAERSVIALPGVRVELVQFLNRLSDWMFTAARFANRDAGGDILWSKSQEPC